MLPTLLSGDGTVSASATSRAQLPLLLNQLTVVTSYDADIAVETDTALDATVFIGAALIPADVAVETDTGLNLTVDNPPGTIFLSVDVAVETATVFAATPVESTPAAYPGITYPSSTTYPWSGDYRPIDIAVETDTAFDVAGAVYDFLFPVSETAGSLLTPAEEGGAQITPVSTV